MGYLVCIIVLCGSIQDGRGSKTLAISLHRKFKSLKTIYVDAAYSGKNLQNWFMTMFYWTIKVIKRTDKGFKILPKRWIVERTFGLWNWYRRLSEDYEKECIFSKEHCEITMIRILLKKSATRN